MISFCLTDGRPWYKQVVSGTLLGVCTIIYSILLLFVIFGFVVLGTMAASDIAMTLQYVGYMVSVVFLMVVVLAIYGWSISCDD